MTLRGADPITKGGFAQVPVVILQHRELSDTAKLVYAMMLYYAWHKNYCFPGQARLAKDLVLLHELLLGGREGPLLLTCF